MESAIEKMRAKQKLAASRGEARGREWLVHELQNKGLTYRKARAAVQSFVEVMREGLRKDRLLETPLGRFELRQRNAYKHARRLCIVFTQEPGWLDGKTQTTNEKGPDATEPS